jgi:hypothetical protein
VLTWPVAPRAGRDVPGDLLDPLFTCWALGWNFHAMGLAPGGPEVASYWDANIFHPTPRALARSEHFAPQAVQGAPVFALTRNLLVTYNALFLSTFVLSGMFLFLLARDDTGDAWAALAGGLFYGFALFRWAQIEHLGALSSQWMPLALLLARRAAGAAPGAKAAGWVLALAAATAIQVTSSGYYLLYFPPMLALWAMVEARRVGGLAPWLRLAGAAAIAVLLALPLVAPYIALRAGGATRDLASVLDHSADLLSWVTAPEITRLWGPWLHPYPRGEARTFPGLAVPILALVAAFGALRAARRERPEANPRPLRGLRVAAITLLMVGGGGVLVALAGGVSVSAGAASFRLMGPTRPALLFALGLGLAVAGWPEWRPALARALRRRETVALGLAALAAWLSLGPIVTWRGWALPLPAPYAWLYAYVPGFSAGRAPARFAMIAACFAALAAAWGVAHLRRQGRGGLALLLAAFFLAETAAMPLPLSRQWDMEEVAAVPEWTSGPSPIVGAIRQLPADAVVAVLPMGEMFHDARAMFDSAHHFRRLLNGYSSWTPRESAVLAAAVRDPLRDAEGALAALRAAGATHVVVHERAWPRDRGPRVTARLEAAGARPLARSGPIVLLAVR